MAWIKKLIFFLFMLSVIYLLVLVLLFFGQTRLIFFPRKITPAYARELGTRFPQAEEITMMAFDQKILHGWFVKSRQSNKAPLLIYFGGNAEEVSHMLGHTDKFRGYALALINYRGYGLSEGEPNEYCLNQDAEIIYDKLSSRTDIHQDKIVVMGRSLGSGVATQLAAKRTVAGVILVTPYDSLVNVARERLKFVPVSLLMTTRFDSLARAPQLKIPLLALLARHDKTVPIKHALRLVESWGGTVKTKIFEEAGHNSIHNSPGYWEAIGDFLAGL